VLVLCIVARARVLGDAVEEATPNEGVSIPGRVVDLENGNPVKGASVVVERLLPGLPASILPAWAGATTLTTDSDGRFVVSIPPEQVAERRLAISLQVAHPDFIPRKSSTAVPLVEVFLGRKGGDRPFFETIKLARGVEYSGQVVTPEGDPAPGATFELAHWGEESDPTVADSSEHFVDGNKGTTDSEGRFRLRAPKTHQLAIYVTPAEHAAFQQFWGTDDPEKQPDIWAPAQLGRLVLSAGSRLSGRLVDLIGRPIAGQLITAKSLYGRHERSARTNADGRFTFAAMRAGNYGLTGQAQSFGGGYDLNALTIPCQGAVFKPARAYLKDGIMPGPVVLREVPTVTIEARFVDSKNRPARGNFVILWGEFPAINIQPVQQQAIFEGEGLAASINGTEREDKNNLLINWQTYAVPDAAGRLVLRAPKGLQNAQIASLPVNETISIGNRIGEGKPLTFSGTGQLEELKADIRGVTFVLYDAPMIVATVRTEDGERPAVNVQVNASFFSDGNEYAGAFIEQADGRFRSGNLIPAQEYEMFSWATGLVPNTVQRLKLQEGASLDLTFIVKRQPRPPSVGDFAPPFLVKTLGGQALSLGDLQGKFVLLHFWNPLDDNCLQELPPLKATWDRFGKSNRLAIIGFCPVTDAKEMTKVIKEKKLSWPQVVLRDRVADSIVLEYDAGELPKTFLIGPDGKLVARDLLNDKVEEAVARALGR
jgi:peroxiredoxin